VQRGTTGRPPIGPVWSGRRRVRAQDAASVPEAGLPAG
jgi:hypothetical protein